MQSRFLTRNGSTHDILKQADCEKKIGNILAAHSKQLPSLPAGVDQLSLLHHVMHYLMNVRVVHGLSHDNSIQNESTLKMLQLIIASEDPARNKVEVALDFQWQILN